MIYTCCYYWLKHTGEDAIVGFAIETAGLLHLNEIAGIANFVLNITALMRYVVSIFQNKLIPFNLLLSYTSIQLCFTPAHTLSIATPTRSVVTFIRI